MCHTARLPLDSGKASVGYSNISVGYSEASVGLRMSHTARRPWPVCPTVRPVCQTVRPVCHASRLKQSAPRVMSRAHAISTLGRPGLPGPSAGLAMGEGFALGSSRGQTPLGVKGVSTSIASSLQRGLHVKRASHWRLGVHSPGSPRPFSACILHVDSPGSSPRPLTRAAQVCNRLTASRATVERDLHGWRERDLHGWRE